MLIDVWKQLSGILPSQTTIIATVIAVDNVNGFSTLQTPEGGTLFAQGVVVGVNAKAYVREGRILGPAPDLPTYDLTV